MEEDIVITIAIAAAVVLIAGQIGRVLRTMILHRTIRRGFMEGSPLAPELIDRIDQKRTSQSFSDDRIGVVLIALGLAVFGFGIIAGGDPDDVRAAVGSSLFPLLVGAALLGRHLVIRRARMGG